MLGLLMDDKEKSLEFLKEFKDLLAKYKAEIDVFGGGMLDSLGATITFEDSTDELEFYDCIDKKSLEIKISELESNP
jgi:hypothetical protein